ncbi:RNA polymerase sporulation sigma factor SigF [Alkalibacillus almallahensis]|uniref:RNA polymerase sporulation sigma factor SigF n=1 Tax=Alkalibacillus almallahensis TaxID=1379154 RepID=UPI001420337C|nr:RNA polymerase sporulation sigma factor SigF [Alkalibacillus almallahensis]
MRENTQVQASQALSHEELISLIQKSQQGDTEARDKIIERNTRLVWSVVQRFINRGYETDDLFQIGCVGLIKSIDKFDISYEVRFSTYAVPMIIGEIQRFIRDDGTIKVSRSLKELNHKIRAKTEELTKQLNRSPSMKELSEALEIPEEDLVLAIEANQGTHSIHETVYENEGDPITLMDQIADQDSNWFDHIALREAIEQLDRREQLIIYMRYYKDQTQADVAQRLQISQVQVSRLEKSILAKLEDWLNS